MLSFAAPALYALFVWWLGTGIVLYLDSLPTRTFRWSLVGASAVLVGALYGVARSASGTELSDIYVAFTCGVLVWGTLEMTYFMGLVSGPHNKPCPPGCVGWRRFVLAIGTSLYHELTIVATAVLLGILTLDAPNQVAFWTFAILWLMRWSAKLNVFLGVPNLNGDWLPEHLQYLQSYMGQRHMNHLFPVSVSAATVVVVLLFAEALSIAADPFGSTALMLLATLLALGVLEHWFLVLPLPDEALWAWAFKPGNRGDTDAEVSSRTSEERPPVPRLALRSR